MAYSNDVQYIDVPLGERDKEKMKEWFAKQQNAESFMLELLSDGYRVSFVHDKRNNCVLCSISTPDDRSINFGCILTSRSGDWWRAFMAGYYKHVVIMKKDWRPMKRVGSDSILDL